MFVIAKKIDGELKFFASRVRWTDRVALVGVFIDSANAFACIDLLPDGDEEGCMVLPVSITVDTENPVIDEGRR